MVYFNCLLLTFGYKFSVSLPYSAVSWSAPSDCGIFWSHSLIFWSFLVYYNKDKSVLLCKLLNFCQCTQTVNYLTTIIALADLFRVEYVRFGKPMTSNLQADVHFRDALEHLHLIDMYFVS